MFTFSQKITRHTIGKVHSEEVSLQASEPESDTAGMLGLSGQDFCLTMINMLRTLMRKIDNM